MPAGILALTKEERIANLVKARAIRATMPKLRLRSDFPKDDEEEWSRLAKLCGVRLPPYGVPCTRGKMSAWLTRLAIPLEAYLEWGGVGLRNTQTSARITDFAVRNPRWPIKAFVGLLLEAIDDGVLKRNDAVLDSAENAQRE
jgi:hypothetical protein